MSVLRSKSGEVVGCIICFCATAWPSRAVRAGRALAAKSSKTEERSAIPSHSATPCSSSDTSLAFSQRSRFLERYSVTRSSG